MDQSSTVSHSQNPTNVLRVLQSSQLNKGSPFRSLFLFQMGKSSKKSATKVDVAPDAALTIKSAKKGKREAQDAIETKLIAKKQKVEEALEQAVQKKKGDTKTQTKKKKKGESSSEASSDSDEDVKVNATKKGSIQSKKPDKEPAPSKKQLPKQVIASKNASAKKMSETSSDSSESDSSDSEDEGAKKSAVPPKKLPVSTKATKKDETSSDSSESDSSDSEDEGAKKSTILPKKLPASATTTKPTTMATKKEETGDDSDSDSDSSEEEPVKTGASTKNGPVDDSSDSSDSDSSSEDEKVKKTQVPPKRALDTSSDESDSDSDDERPTTKAVLPSKRAAESKEKLKNDESSDDESSEDDSSENEEPQKKKIKVPPTVAAGKPTNLTKGSSSEEESDESSDDEPAKKTTTKASSGSSSEDEESEDELPSKTPKKNDSDVVMVDALNKEKKAPKTPATPQTQSTGSKTVFVGNLSYNVEEDDVRNFFGGEIVDIRFAQDPEGRFKGFGHVEFDTPEAAQNALKLNGTDLLGRTVKLDLARERGAYTPHSGRESNSNQGGGKTLFVRGFDRSLGEEEVKNALNEQFGPCGNIIRLSVPQDYETGGVKGIAYIDFSDGDSFNKALEYNGTELGGNYLTVEEAKPRENRSGGNRGRFSGDRDNSGGRFNRGGRFNSGGRFDSGGRRPRGGRGDFGRRGRGGFNKPSLTPQGKKTTFED